MPFTFAHPAIFIPLEKKLNRKLSITGLVIGSMVPDFEFFLKMRTGENIGHHWYGIFLFDIPLAIVMCYLFHFLLKEMIINNSPDWFYQRLSKWVNFDWNNYLKQNKLIVFSSIVLGIFSHLFLDAFTHEDGFFVEQISFLKSDLIVFGIHTNTYMLLQISESILGLYLVFQFVRCMPVNTKYRYKTDELIWLPTAILTFSFFILRLLLMPQYMKFWDLFMALMGSLIYSFLLIGLFKKVSETFNWQVE